MSSVVDVPWMAVTVFFQLNHKVIFHGAFSCISQFNAYILEKKKHEEQDKENKNILDSKISEDNKQPE